MTMMKMLARTASPPQYFPMRRRHLSLCSVSLTRTLVPYPLPRGSPSALQAATAAVTNSLYAPCIHRSQASATRAHTRSTSRSASDCHHHRASPLPAAEHSCERSRDSAPDATVKWLSPGVRLRIINIYVCAYDVNFIIYVCRYGYRI